MELLEASLQSRTALTDVFLGKKTAPEEEEDDDLKTAPEDDDEDDLKTAPRDVNLK